MKEKVRKCDLFEGISDDDCNYLCSYSREKVLESGQILFIEGDSGSVIFLVLSGEIELFKSTSDDRETVIKTAVPGEIFAEILLFEQDTYPVSSRATKKTSLLEISVSVIHRLLERPEFRALFISGLFRKMRHLTERIIFLSGLAVEDRFFAYLSEKYGKKNEYEILSQKQEIAREIGTVPETFSRMVNRLKRRGIIWEGCNLTLPDGFWAERTIGYL